MENQKFTVVEKLRTDNIDLDGLYKFVARPVYCTVPANLEEKSHGLVSKTYFGCICSHHEGGFCVEPRTGTDSHCFAIEPGMSLEILPGTWSDFIKSVS